jgi:predicted RNA binding protein YcfA (HicA-like mRNA interferase family)
LADRLTPCSRAEFIRKLRALGYDGPFIGGLHQYMAAKGKRAIIVPNPHGGDISVNLLRRILRDSAIDRDRWSKA